MFLLEIGGKGESWLMSPKESFQAVTKYVKDFFLVALSSILLVLSFPKFDFGFLAWVGLVPFLITLIGKGLKYSFLLSFTGGIIYFAGIFNWILQVPGYTPLIHHPLLGLYLGPVFGCFGLSVSFISRRWGVIPALSSAPFTWVILEYIRSNLDFLALPWGLLAHSQYQYPVIIQIASIIGTYGISFLIVLVNAALASFFLGRLKSPLPQNNPPPSPFSKGGSIDLLPFLKGGWEGLRGKKYLLATAALFLFFTLAYGHFTITDTITGNKIKISLVQGNISQGRKWDPKFAQEIMQIYSELTEEVSKNHPTLIIWPETATPRSIAQSPMAYIAVKNVAKNAGAYLLLGSADQQKFFAKGAAPKKAKYYNSACLIHPDPQVTKNQRYDKIRLFPFGEYLPYKDIFPWPLINVRESGEYAAGKEFTVFEIPEARFGVIICWENVFPDLVRQFVKRGAQFMINITNEARFGRSEAPYHLAAISVFRAVENRMYVVRCANTGISCIIDPYGRIVDRVQGEKGQDIFVRGTLTGWIIPLDSKTIYTQYGDWLVWVVFVGSVAFLLIGWRRGRLVRKESETS